MRRNCRTCRHPNAELINTELALAHSTEEVSKKWGVPSRTLREHRAHCMTQEQIARLRYEIQPVDKFDIDEHLRNGGKTAVLGLAHDIHKLEMACERCEKQGLEANFTANRKLIAWIRIEQAKQAGQYPGTKKVTNNTLVLSDGGAMFEMVGRILNSSNSIDDARRLYAAELRKATDPLVLEAQAA